jgi:hypothetical protein
MPAAQHSACSRPGKRSRAPRASRRRRSRRYAARPARQLRRARGRERRPAGRRRAAAARDPRGRRRHARHALLYIWIRFELRFAVGATMAVLHDVLITIGFFAWSHYEFNLTTVAAFLTLIGYSVNDTVVTFDRVRENLRRSRSLPFVDVLNRSINQTLSRTILTGGHDAARGPFSLLLRRRRHPRLRLRDGDRRRRRHLLVDLHRQPVRAPLGVSGSATRRARPVAGRPRRPAALSRRSRCGGRRIAGRGGVPVRRARR